MSLVLVAEEKAHIYSLSDPRDGLVRYIGKTIHPNKRLNEHISQSKNSPYFNRPVSKWIGRLLELKIKPQFKILHTVSSDKWTDTEIEFIAHYKQFCNLLNSNSGGYGNNNPSEDVRKAISLRTKGKLNPFYGRKHTNEAKRKMRASTLLEKPKTKEHMELMLKKMLEKQHLWIHKPREYARKVISCLNITDGAKIDFIGISHAARVLDIKRSCIDNNLSGLSKVVNKKYIFTYVKKENSSFFKKGEVSHNARAILQYNKKDGSFVKEWRSINHAKITLKINNISKVLSGERVYVGGYFWKYKNQ